MPIHVFIDSGADQNFLNPSVAQRLGKVINPKDTEKVVVATGNTHDTKGVVYDIADDLQMFKFRNNYRLLAVAGCHLVLEVEWLATLGLIGWSFKEKLKEFKVGRLSLLTVGMNIGGVRLIQPQLAKALMNSIFRSFLRKYLLVFFDDILVYSGTLSEHITHLAHVFEVLRAHQLKVKFSKCAFAQKSVAYSGHVISAARVAMDPIKVQCIEEWPKPTTIKGLRGLGLSRYYMKFVQGFGPIARPLICCTKIILPGRQKPSQHF